MDALLYCSCGIDVHKEMIEACITRGSDSATELIRKHFLTTPADICSFVQWLYDNDCYHIAMESTGVYWRPIYEAIEKHSPYYESIIVGNAHHIKNVPGRKSDVKDAEWISTLLRYGLIQKSFVPNITIRTLREAARTYKKFIGENLRYKNRVEKLQQTHGVKLSNVLSDIFCVTGIHILNTLTQRGSLSVQDVETCIKGKTKFNAIEIHAAISTPINTLECKTLSLLLKRLYTSQEDLQDVISLMVEIAAPYQKQLDQLDSIPGIDKVAALLILAEIGSTPLADFETFELLCS